MPLTPVLVQRRATIHGLVAKGWKLDLSKAGGLPGQGIPAEGGKAPEAALKATERASVRGAALALFGKLASLQLPLDLSLDDVELEGEVVLPCTEGGNPVTVHITLTGGGMATAMRGHSRSRLRQMARTPTRALLLPIENWSFP